MLFSNMEPLTNSPPTEVILKTLRSDNNTTNDVFNLPAKEHTHTSTTPFTTAQHITIFSFFSGIGLLDLGFELCGYDVAFVNEFSKNFLNGYKHSREKMNISPPQYGYFCDDINSLLFNSNADKLKHDVSAARSNGNIVGFIGGPPCPDFSIGGKNRGKDGDNGSLSASYVAIIKKFQPDFFLFENVKGLWLTQKHRTFYEELKADLQEAGYITTERLINSVELGVPQDRDRIILLGFKNTLFSSNNFQKGKRLIFKKFPWDNHTLYQKEEIFSMPWPQQASFKEDSIIQMPHGIITELTVQHWFQRNDVENHPNAIHCFKPREGLKKFLIVDEGDDSRKSSKRLHRWRYSPTACYGNNEVHLHPYKARRISAAEALAIQSLPKEFELPENMKLSHMFKSIGNGVPFLMAKYLATTLLDFLSETVIKSSNVVETEEVSTPTKQLDLF